MLYDVLQKLTSKRGASLSMALMLMLVCTTVAGVALTAATVVAGRQAKTKDVDKSYYNVTSAAKLYWDEMHKDGSIVVKIERSCTFGSDGKVVWDCKVGDKSVVFNPINNTNASLFELASYDYLFNYTAEELDFKTARSRTTENANQGISWPQGTTAPPEVAEIDPEVVKDCAYASFDITPSATLADHFKTVQVTVKRKLANTFELVFSEKPKDGESKASPYECTLTVAMMFGEWNVTSEKDDAGNPKSYTATAQVSWTPLSMNAGRSGQ